MIAEKHKISLSFLHPEQRQSQQPLSCLFQSQQHIESCGPRKAVKLHALSSGTQ